MSVSSISCGASTSAIASASASASVCQRARVRTSAFFSCAFSACLLHCSCLGSLTSKPALMSSVNVPACANVPRRKQITTLTESAPSSPQWRVQQRLRDGATCGVLHGAKCFLFSRGCLSRPWHALWSVDSRACFLAANCSAAYFPPLQHVFTGPPLHPQSIRLHSKRQHSSLRQRCSRRRISCVSWQQSMISATLLPSKVFAPFFLPTNAPMAVCLPRSLWRCICHGLRGKWRSAHPRVECSPCQQQIRLLCSCALRAHGLGLI